MKLWFNSSLCSNFKIEIARNLYVFFFFFVTGSRISSSNNVSFVHMQQHLHSCCVLGLSSALYALVYFVVFRCMYVLKDILHLYTDLVEKNITNFGVKHS